MARPLPAAVVEPEQIAAFQRDGAVCLRGLLNAAEIATLRAGIDRNLANLSPRAKVASQANDPGLFVEDFCNWSEIAEYHTVIFAAPLAQAAARLTNSQQIRLYHDHMLTKESGTQSPTPWHQDQPYYNIDGKQTVSFWIPVDPVSRQATLEFVAGTHLGPWLMPRSFMSKEARWFPEGSLADMPDIEANRDAFPILGWALEPGDCVAFNMLTVHGSRGTEPGRRRRVFSLRVMGDDVRHAPRRWVTSPAFTGLEQELPANAPMHHPIFPLLYPPAAG